MRGGVGNRLSAFLRENAGLVDFGADFGEGLPDRTQKRPLYIGNLLGRNRIERMCKRGGEQNDLLVLL